MTSQLATNDILKHGENKMIATVTSKGRVTLPAEAQKRLKLKPGAKLRFVVIDEERLEVIPVKETVKSLKGMASTADIHLTLEDIENCIAKGSLS